MGTGAGYRFQEWLRANVRAEGRAPALPRSPEEVPKYHEEVRRRLERAAGVRPEYDPLDAVVHQTRVEEGYRVEAVSFNTFAGLRMTANAYVPDLSDPVPGILAVHGHYKHGRRDPVQQRRCAALAKQGYFVLSVDCFGSGERSVELPGSYHGGIEAAALWLTGTSLFGVQIHENVRAGDYLASRPEVDPERLAITGASGGGNQTLYTAAWDARFKVAIPVVAIGSYHKVVATSNCMCETPFGLAGELEQYDILALIAPRPVLVISAMNDGVNFRFEDAEESVAQAAEVWRLLGAQEKIRFKAIPTRHGYHQPMREAAMGWLDRWVRGAHSDAPVPETEMEPAEYAAISCYPEAETPQVKTIRHHFADRRSKALAVSSGTNDVTLERLRELLLGDPKNPLNADDAPLRSEVGPPSGRIMGVGRILHGSGGLAIPVWALRPDLETTLERVLVRVGNSKDEVFGDPEVRRALDAGWHVWAVDLPGVGEAILPHETGQTVTNAVRACHMLGFTLAGLWIKTINQVVKRVRAEGASEVALSASGVTATPVLMGAALLEDADRIIVHRPLSSYVHGDHFATESMSAMIPGALEVGDVPEWAALRAPQPLTIVAPKDALGEPLSASTRALAFAALIERYAREGAAKALAFVGPQEADVRTGL